MKAQIIDFIHHLLIYDYLLFGGIFILFILLLTLAIAFRKKMGLAIFLVLVAFGVLTAGPVGGYIALHHYLFKHTIIIHEVKALEFTEALLIKGDINNTSKRPFKECTLHAGVYKVTHNKYIDPLYPYLPFKKSSLKLQVRIDPGKSVPFKLFVEPFRYTKDYNLTLKGECR
ncbi:MAG: DUF2393 family protein [Sulfuricurvum sp.]|uniref:DUF2393 family protein n=1 Tax=Sulfuricurvum sp. TaxID=2025608 RepID=UPI002620C714|nr:DUF2393 family protein [Sulfuricurvum sp.]MDD2838184.1 DUF2393 family protein [Sulfuricurvum sp.]MDD3596201.1 DUF2393 family protein [Sulfuricurvum sp.]